MNKRIVLQPREAAQYLGVSLLTLGQMRSKGTLTQGVHYFRVHGVSGESRYFQDALDQWVENQQGVGT
jgi:hypothetical protein